MNRRFFLYIFLVFAVIIAGCDGGGGTTSQTEAKYILNISIDPIGSGSVNPQDGNQYNVGTTVSLSPIAAEGYEFDHWLPDGAVTNDNGTWKILMNSNKTITAHFVAKSTQPVNGSLSNLTISEGTLDPFFAQNQTSYTALVDYDVESITLTPTLTDPGNSLLVNGGTATSGQASLINLGTGYNNINIEVYSPENVLLMTYTIGVTRPATDLHLESLAVSPGTLDPVFDKETRSYTVNLPYGTTAISVTPAAVNAENTVTVNDVNVVSGTAWQVDLTPGSNTITIEVNYCMTYTVTANVSATAPGTDATLASLTVSESSLTPAFASDTYTYGLANDLYQAASIDVTPAVNDSNATVIVTNETTGDIAPSTAAAYTVPLDEGTNTIKISVTAEDNFTILDYTLTVKVNDERTWQVAATRSETNWPNALDGKLSFYAVDGTPYYAIYYGGINVRKYDGSWSTVGNLAANTNIASTFNISIATEDSNPYVSYCVGNEPADTTTYIQHFTGTTWESCGSLNGSSKMITVNNGSPAICTDGKNQLGELEATLWTYNGGWAEQGSHQNVYSKFLKSYNAELHLGLRTSPLLNNHNYAYIANGQSLLEITADPTTYTLVPFDFCVDGNGNYYIMYDGDIKQYKNGEWNIIGSMTGSNGSIYVHDNKIYYVYSNGDHLYVKKYIGTGTTWDTLGTIDHYEKCGSKILLYFANDRPHLIFAEGTNDSNSKITILKYE